MSLSSLIFNSNYSISELESKYEFYPCEKRTQTAELEHLD